MKKVLAAVAIVALFLFFCDLAGRDFWAPDEGDFAQIVRELDNDLVVPHLNGTPYAEKPPLFYYAEYVSKKFFYWTPDEWSLRIPSAASALLCAIAFASLLCVCLGRKEAFLASFILLASPLYYWQARYLQVDMLFSSLLAGSLLAFYYFYHSTKNSYIFLFFLLLGLAFMTKGPVALALAAPVVLIFLLWEMDFGFFKVKETYLGLLLFLVIVIPWYLIVYAREGWPFLYENIVKQNFIRFFDAWSHKRPFYYYFTTLPLDFFPWSLFLPMGFLLAFRRIRKNPETRFFALWFTSMFLFLSFSSGKISKYMLPLLPAAAFIASLGVADPGRTYNRWIYRIVALLFFGSGIALLFYKTGLYPEFHPQRVLFGLLCLLLALSLFILILRRKWVYSFPVLCCGVIAFFLLANLFVYGKWNSYKSPRAMCEKIRTYVAHGAPWAYYGSMRGVYVYYVGKLAIECDEHDIDCLRRLPDRSPEFYILTRKRDSREVNEALGAVETLFEQKIGDTDMIFMHFKRKA